VAQEARVRRAARIELGCGSKATNPALQLRTEHLIWQIRAKLIGDRPVQIDRYKGKTITDRATANSPST